MQYLTFALHVTAYVCHQLHIINFSGTFGNLRFFRLRLSSITRVHSEIFVFFPVYVCHQLLGYNR